MPAASNPASAARRIDPPADFFRPIDLASESWPHSFAKAHVGDGDARTWFVRIDPRRSMPHPVQAAAPSAEATSNLVTAWLVPLRPRGDATGLALYAQRQLVGWRYSVGSTPADAPPGDLRVLLRGASLQQVPQARRTIGVDRDGFLVYVEHGLRDNVTLLERQRQAGLEGAIALEDTTQLLFAKNGQLLGVDERVRSIDPQWLSFANALAFVADRREATEVLFPDNSPQPYRVWSRLQDSRVRYFREEPPRFHQE